MLKALNRLVVLGMLGYCASALTELLVKLSALQEAVERLDKPARTTSIPHVFKVHPDLMPPPDSKRGGHHGPH